jgi:sulfur carrier protein
LIQVMINGTPHVIDPASTVDALVEQLGCGRRGVAVAVNSEVVPRSAWARTPLTAGDRVEVLQAAQGG